MRRKLWEARLNAVAMWSVLSEALGSSAGAQPEKRFGKLPDGRIFRRVRPEVGLGRMGVIL